MRPSNPVVELAPGLARAASYLEGVALVSLFFGVLGGMFLALYKSTDAAGNTTHPDIAVGIAIIGGAIVEGVFSWAIARAMRLFAEYTLMRSMALTGEPGTQPARAPTRGDPPAPRRSAREASDTARRSRIIGLATDDDFVSYDLSTWRRSDRKLVEQQFGDRVVSVWDGAIVKVYNEDQSVAEQLMTMVDNGRPRSESTPAEQDAEDSNAGVTWELARLLPSQRRRITEELTRATIDFSWREDTLWVAERHQDVALGVLADIDTGN